jgi:hypothetical protein
MYRDKVSLFARLAEAEARVDKRGGRRDQEKEL